MSTQKSSAGTKRETDKGTTKEGTISEIKRLNINLPQSTFDILQGLAKETNRSMTDIMRTALSLVIVAMNEEMAGNKLVVVNQDAKLSDAKLIKELILPK